MPRTAWGRFWFQPTDPTVLGFMRIVTGLIAFYVHLAYCYDLGAFFGPDAFVDQQSAYKFRREYPTQVVPWDWQQQSAMPQTPLLPDRRAAVFDFLRGLPEDKKVREELLFYFYYVLENPGTGDGDANRLVTYNGLVLAKDAGKLDAEQRERMLGALTRKEFIAQDVPITLPVFFLSQHTSVDDRLRLWRAALGLSDFLWELPAFQDPDYQVTEKRIGFVIFWMVEMFPSQRRDLANFLHKLPPGEEGRKVLEYFQYWRVDPRDMYDRGTSTFSIWYHLTNIKAIWAVHIIVLVIFVLFTLGIFTRVTSVLAWLAALQYIHRTQQVLFGMDTMMNILLFYLMIGPSGAALSVDRLIARYRAARAIFKARGKAVNWAEATLAGPQPSVMANFAIRLFQVHFCIIYGIAGLAKLKGTMWWNTQATWWTIANPEFTPMNYGFYEETLRTIATFKPLLLICFAIFTYFTLIMEIGFPFLVWTRLRPIALSLAAFLHAGIAIIMGLTCFQLLMMVMLLAYLPAAVIRNRLVWEAGAGPKMSLRYDGKNSGHMRLVAFLRAFDLTGQIACHDEAGKSNAHHAIELIGADGRTHSGDAIVQHALANLVFARAIRWLFYVPGVMLLIRGFANANGHEGAANGTSSSPSAAKTPSAS